MFLPEKYELEQAILDVFKSKEDFGCIFEYACESNEEEFDQEATANLLLGAIEFMNVRLNHLYRVYDEMESDAKII